MNIQFTVYSLCTDYETMIMQAMSCFAYGSMVFPRILNNFHPTSKYDMSSQTAQILVDIYIAFLTVLVRYVHRCVRCAACCRIA